MKKVRLLVFSCLTFVSFDTASWAQKKAAPPKSVDDGPSLEATMKFIHDKVSEQGKVNFAVFTHDDITGEDGAAQYSFEVTDLSLDATNCQFRVQSKFSYGSGSDKQTHLGTAYGPVKSITDSVLVMAAEYWWKLELAEEGTPSRTARV
jgi:hypothetical protein